MNAAVKTPGQQLKAAREEMGKTLSELAKTTRIGVTQLQGLEEDDYSKIPAPMYVRGFMKIYAQELGMRHEPLVELYERMQNGESLTERKPAGPAVPAPVEDAPEPVDSYPSRRKIPRPPLPAVRLDLRAIRDRLPGLPDFRSRLDAAWLRSSRVRMAAAGAAVLLLLIAGVRSCGGGSGEAEPESGSERPEVEEPLLNSPDPVYFEVPRSIN